MPRLLSRVQRALALVLWLLACVLPPTTWAGADAGRSVLDRGWSVLHDRESALDIDDMTRPEVSKRFEPMPGAPSLGYLRGAAWLKLTLAPVGGMPGERLLELQFPPIDEATLFWPDASGQFKSRKAGDRHPLELRDQPARNIVYRVTVSAEQPQTFYLRLEGRNAQNFTVVLWEPARYMQASATEQLLWGIVLAVHLVLILSNLWFFQATRDMPHGLFALFVGLSFLSVLSLEGFAYRYLLDRQPLLNDALVVASWMLAMPAAFLFVLRYTGLIGPGGRAWARALLLGLWLFSAGMVTADQVVEAPWARPIFSAVHLLTVPLMAGLLVVQSWRGSPDARLMLIAMGPMMIAVGTRLGRNLGLLPPHPLFDHGYYVGLVLYLLILNFAVSRRHQALLEGAHLAQAQALADSQRTARELEARVAERTADIAAAMQQVQGSLALERRLRQQQREFFATVSHQMRTPLAVIDASAHNLSLANPALPGNARQRVEKILLAAKRIAGLLDRHLYAGDPEDETERPQRQVCRVDELVRDATASATLLVDEHSLSIDVSGAPMTFACDPELTRLALANLVDNAVKYTPKGTKVTLLAYAQGRRASDGLIIEVADDGPGIPAQDRIRLFAGPFRAHATSNTSGTGTGLLLARKMIQSQGGDVTLEFPPEGGTVARICLPGDGPGTTSPQLAIRVTGNGKPRSERTQDSSSNSANS